MVKVTTEYESSDHEARREAQQILNAHEAHAALQDLNEWLRGQIKYGDRDELQEIRDYLHEVCNDRGIDLY